MNYRFIRYEVSERIATVTLARPDRLNALTPVMIDEMTDAMQRAPADGARALVLTGDGRAFCSGADLADGLPDDLGQTIDRHYNPLSKAMADSAIPIVVAINGPAAGAGCGFALSGDIMVMARSAYLLLAFVNIGLVPDAGATWMVAKGAGRTKALEMALLGERMDAEQALVAGLVTRVADDETVVDEAMAIARRLADGPTRAISLIRKQVAAALQSTLDETLAIERTNQTQAGRTRDFAEAVAAFAAKRPPEFKGE